MTDLRNLYSKSKCSNFEVLWPQGSVELIWPRLWVQNNFLLEPDATAHFLPASCVAGAHIILIHL